MPRGGARPGAGRPRKNPEALAKKRAKAKPKVAPAKPLKAAKADRGLTLPNGQKSPDAPPGWPFGTLPPADPVALTPQTPLEYLLEVMRSIDVDPRTRLQAASLAAPYMHAKPAPQGKKEGRNEAAKKVASRFAPSAPPKLAAVGGKKV